MSTLRETLAEHWFVVLDKQAPRTVGCRCGWTQPADDRNAERHATHLEAVVLAWVGARLAGAREDARLAVDAEMQYAFSAGLDDDAGDMAAAAIQAVLSALRVQPHADEGVRPADRQPGGSTGVVCPIDTPHGPHGIQTFIAGGEPGPVPLRWGRWCPGRDAACEACPFLGCDSCEAETPRRANGEAK